MKIVQFFKDKICIKTNNIEFCDIRINDLFLVSDKTSNLIVSVTSLTDADIETELEENDYITSQISLKKIECDILGSLDSDGKFVKSINRYPTTNVDIKKIDSDFFKRMIISSTGECFLIGKYSEYDCCAWVDGNKFFQRHSCIVGNTGSGKSETISKILEETVRLDGANIIIFDIHGEYNKNASDNIKIGKDFAFPIWLFGFSGMVSNILKIKEETSGIVMSALQKCYKQISDNGNLNKPIHFSYNELVEKMQELNNEQVLTDEVYKTGNKAGMPKRIKGDYNGKLSNVLNIMKAKQNDKRYQFLFVNKEQEYLYEIVQRMMNNDRKVKNIDLSDIPHDVAIPLIGTIAKLVYDVQRNMKANITPITLVCDEAHVYIPNNLQLSSSEQRMVGIFETIAKEGRKFGMTLLIASQRPSELNKTIMAQCANFIVGKMNNENDKSMIKGMLPDGSKNMIDSTTMFSPGDVIIVGDAVPIPLKIHVELAKKRPESQTINFWDFWKKRKESHVEDAIEKYISY